MGKKLKENDLMDDQQKKKMLCRFSTVTWEMQGSRNWEFTRPKRNCVLIFIPRLLIKIYANTGTTHKKGATRDGKGGGIFLMPCQQIT